MKSLKELGRAVDPDRISAFGAVRRMAITLTAKALWQLAGFVIDGRTEVVKAEPFTGIGIAARPPSSGKPEAIVIMVGDATNPMVIAVRDEKTRAAIAGALAADETMLFNSTAFVHVKATGKVEVGTPAGVAQPTLKGTSYRTAENTLLTALNTLATALGVFAGLCVTAPVTTPATTLNTAIGVFTAANIAFQAASATYLTTVLEAE